MDLSDFYPTAGDLIESELSVLDHLRQNRYIKENHPQVAVDAENYFRGNKASRCGFEFNSHFDIYHVQMPGRKVAPGSSGTFRPNARLIVSARIEVNRGAFTNVSYCLSVCRIQGHLPTARLAVLRKFHFDVTVPGGGAHQRRQQHPQCHIQYCGEMVPYMLQVGCREAQLDHMHPELSEPRIFFWPMSLALLIDLALHEFPDQDSANFRAENYWHGLVRKQEALVLQRFCEKCVEIIKDNKGERQTLADAFYIG